jgi:polysaccharide biosynthesis/export protein
MFLRLSSASTSLSAGSPFRQSAATLLAALAVLVFSAATHAGQPNTAGSPATPAGAIDYRIGPGDLLAVSVFGADAFEHRSRVSNSGRIHVPFVGAMHVAEMTVRQLEAELAERLRAMELVRDPWVSVRIEQYRARPVYVLGEVMNPGQYMIKDEMRVVDLITLAIGLNEVASDVGYLYRRKPVPPDSDVPGAMGSDPSGQVAAVTDEAIPIDLDALMTGTRPELNFLLQAGDVLYVPEGRKEHFFVIGDVRRPGVFELSRDQSLSLTQAIVAAGGPLRTAKTSRAMVVRVDESGTREELRIDFKALLQGRRPDLPVQPNDIIFIPGSSAKSLGYGLLTLVPGIATRTLVYR